MTTTGENVAFLVVRGAVALAIVGLAFYCVGQGIRFLALPQFEAQQIHVHLVGMDITASGLGAIIFASGIALCFVGRQTAPKRIERTKNAESVPQVFTERLSEPPRVVPPSPDPPAIAPYAPTYTPLGNTHESVVFTDGPKTPPVRLD
jgi:hypothetical protein